MAENEWTDELKQQVIAAYEELEPTAETTMDAVKTVANDFDKTPNGVRMILSKAGVYVKKTPAAGGSSSSGSTSGAKRINKAEAIAALKQAIEDSGKEVDNDICDRLTGKAAVYITGLLS
jgi:transposase-like protein